MSVILFITDLLKSWKSSFQFFLPPIVKPFMLVGIKTIVQTYAIFFEQLWPLITVAGIAQLAYMWFCIPSAIGCFLVWLLAHTLSMLMVFCMFLIIRPSIKAKSIQYYVHYLPHFLLFWAISLVYSYFNSLYYLTSPLFILYMFFVLDTPFDLRNIFWNGWRALKMLIYGLPYCIVVWLVLGILLSCTLIICVVPLWMLFQSMTAAEQAGQFIIYLLLPCVFVWYDNFYVKRVREQFGLYF